MAGGNKEYVLTFLLKAATDSSYNAAFNNAKAKLNEYQQTIRKNNSTLSDISAYQRQQAAVERAAQKAQEKAAALQKASQAAKEAGRANDALNEKETKAKNALEAANQRLRQQTEKLSEMGDKLKTAGVDVNNLSEAERQLAAATEQVKKEQEALAEKQNAMMDEVAEMEALAAEAYVAVQAVGKLKDAWMSCVSAAEGFEYSLSGVQAVSGATDEELRQLGATAKEIGAETVFTATEISDAMEYMGLAGWNTSEIIAGIEPVANLTAAAGENLSRVCDIVTDSMQALGYGAEDAGHFCDVLAKTVTSANTTVDLMGDTLKYVSSTAGALGYNIEDVSTAIAILADNGIKGSMNGTALRNILANLADPSKEAAEALDELNVSLSDENGQVVQLDEVWRQLRAGLEGYSEAEKVAYASTIAGKRGMAGLLAILNTTNEEYADMRATIEDCEGAANAMAETRLDNLQGNVIILESAFDALKTSIGEIYLDNLSGGAELLTDITNKANGFVKIHPEIVAGATAAAAAFGVMAVGITGVTTAIKLLDTVLLGSAIANPAMWGALATVSAIVGIGVALYELGSNAETATERMGNLLDEMGTLNNNEELIETYKKTSEAMKESGLSAKKLAEYQEGLDATAELLKEAYPELLGDIEAGTEAWDLQTEAILRNIEAQKLAAGDDIESCMGEVVSLYVEAQNQISRAETDYETAMRHWSEASNESTDEIIDSVQGMRDELAEGIEAGDIDINSTAFASKLSEMEKSLEAATGQDFIFRGLADVDSALENLSDGYYDTAGGAEYWSNKAIEASNGNIKALEREQEAVKQMRDAIDSGIMTFGEVRDAAEGYNLTLGELGYTSEFIGEQVETGVLTAGEAMNRYGITMNGVEYAVSKYKENVANSMKEAAASMQETGEATKFSAKVMWEYSAAAAAVDMDLMDAEQAAIAYGMSVEDLNQFIEANENYEKKLSAACALVENGFMDAEHAAAVFGITTEEMELYQAKQNLESLEQELEDLQKAYDSAYQSALSSIQGQGSLLDGLSLDADRTELTLSDALANMQEIGSYWSSYNANLTALQGYGLNTDFLSRFCDTSAEGVANTSDLAGQLGNLSNGQIQWWVEYLNAGFESMAGAEDTAASSTADLQTNFTEASAEIQREMQTMESQVSGIMQTVVADLNQSGAASAAGTATGAAYASSLAVQLDAAVRKAQSTAAIVNSALSSSSGTTGTVKPKFAKGGFTNGPSVAGEDPNYPTEAVISFNPAYREENIGYLQTAAKMLGVGQAEEKIQYMNDGTAYQFGGLTEYGESILTRSMANVRAVTVERVSETENGNHIEFTYSPHITVKAEDGESIREQLNAYNGELESRINRVIENREKDRRRRSYDA